MVVPSVSHDHVTNIGAKVADTEMALDPNVLFYRNELTSRPQGATIETMLAEWHGDFNLLERHHGYIQVCPPRPQHTVASD